MTTIRRVSVTCKCGQEYYFEEKSLRRIRKKVDNMKSFECKCGEMIDIEWFKMTLKDPIRL